MIPLPARSPASLSHLVRTDVSQRLKWLSISYAASITTEVLHQLVQSFPRYVPIGVREDECIVVTRTPAVNQLMRDYSNVLHALLIGLVSTNWLILSVLECMNVCVTWHAQNDNFMVTVVLWRCVFLFHRSSSHLIVEMHLVTCGIFLFLPQWSALIMPGEYLQFCQKEAGVSYFASTVRFIS